MIGTMKRTFVFLTLLALLALCLPGFSQDFDSLFEEELIEEDTESTEGENVEEKNFFEEDLVEEPEAESSEQVEAAPEEVFLVSEQLEWGGRFESSFESEWGWKAYPNSWNVLFTEANPAFTTVLKADLFFDARPSRNFRVFGKAKASYEYDLEIALAGGNPWFWDAEIFELFSDFQYRDLLFFRTGKQTIQWGVGYRFSPADVLNLVSIDPEDPGGEREGPISLKVHYPFSTHNAYLYLVANKIDKPYEIAVAPKIELLIGNYELGLGAFYQKDFTPKGMFTLTGALWELDLFGEAMVQWGSDRTFVRPSLALPFYDDYQFKNELIASATVGFSYLNADYNLSLFAQYFFNGQGYREKYDLEWEAFESALLDPDSNFSSADLLYPGRHYLAFSAGWSEILDSEFSTSVLYLANLSDGSGLVAPSISWELFEHFTLSTGFRVTYGGSADEYSTGGASLAYTLSASLGSGRF